MSFPNDFQLSADDPLFRADAPPVITMVPADGTGLVTETQISVGGVLSPMTQVSGVAIGEVESTIIRVFVAQLRLDPDTMARRGYDFEDDNKFEALKESIRQWQSNIEPLICEPTGEIARIDGQDRPLLWVRAGLRRYYALTELQMSYALVQILPYDTGAKERALLALVKNETQEALPVLDRCDLVYELVTTYRMREEIIAGYIGMAQSQVSRLYIAACQPTRIRTYLGNKSLTLDAIEHLNKRIDDPAAREVAAHYIVQETLRGQKLLEFLNDVAPPKGMTPHATLVIKGDGTSQHVVKEATGLTHLAPEKPRLVPSAAKPEPLPYWKRGTPLFASPMLLLNHPHQVVVTGPVSDPEVVLGDLRSRQLYIDMDQKHASTVALRMLEEAMLSDLEAIRAALEAEGRNVQRTVATTPIVEGSATRVS